jgi:hypothetical protein
MEEANTKNVSLGVGGADGVVVSISTRKDNNEVAGDSNAVDTGTIGSLGPRLRTVARAQADTNNDSQRHNFNDDTGVFDRVADSHTNSNSMQTSSIKGEIKKYRMRKMSLNCVTFLGTNVWTFYLLFGIQNANLPVFIVAIILYFALIGANFVLPIIFEYKLEKLKKRLDDFKQIEFHEDVIRLINEHR